MNEPTSKINLTAVVSFEGSLEKLHSCLKALDTWVPKILVILPEGDEDGTKIVENLKVSICTERATTTKARWESGLNKISSPWGLFLRSNEIVTGKLRKAITDKIKSPDKKPYKYPLPLTMVFLKKRLKFSLDWHCSERSHLAYVLEEKNFSYQQEKHVLLDGELIRYGEDTLSECAAMVIKKADERASNLAQYIENFSPLSLILRSVICSTKIFLQTYILNKGFKEGFEGITFAVCNAHAEILGHLRYYELYIRGGKLLHGNLSSLENILIIKLRDIGDNILSTPLIRNLKHHLPNTSISILTWSYSVPIFEKNPHIDHLFRLSKNPSSESITKLQNELSSFNFDLVISTHSGGLPSRLLSKIKTSNKINNFYRGRNKHYTVLTNESDYYRSSIERDLDCLRSLGLEPVNTHTEIFIDKNEISWAREVMKDKGLDPTKKTILIHPTAGVTIREWPLEKFKQLIKTLNQNTKTQSIAICTELEYSKVKTLLDDIPELVIFHKTTVRQMVAIINECDLVIDNDSSPSHVATALRVPTIVLFSQAIRKIFRPYHPKKDKHFIFYNDVDCRECELTECENRICLDFSSDEVYTQALKMLSIEKN
ncbi:MAG: hypothetical protein HOB32_10385 [Nitrospina sp.]|nr:hypothetical protein [Nitrospina sp.]MBT6602041.1 hypothetical protein [Nitrospina sp.]